MELSRGRCKRERKERNHPETSLVRTFRMVRAKAKEKEKVILGELLGTVEVPSTAETVKGEEKPETGNTRSGMTGSQLVQVGKEDPKMNTVSSAPTVNH